MLKSAVILAAGRSSSFKPFIYEKPKGLFTVKGEVLIERQIRQFLEAGIKDIYLVVGHLKEQYFYLEEKYGVTLIVNNSFLSKGNIFSLYAVKDFLKNTYITCADQYFEENPFLDENKENISYRACIPNNLDLKEFSVSCNENNLITSFNKSSDTYIMIGHAYFNETFSKRLIEIMEKTINSPRNAVLFWEEFYGLYLKELELFVKIYDANYVYELDNIEDLLQFDSDFLANIDSNIIKNICETLNCKPRDITNIKTIQSGLTNVSFSFVVNNIKYVYRHPGWTANYLVQRETEMYAQHFARELGLDNSFIKMGDSGWKISYFIENNNKYNLRDKTFRKTIFSMLKKYHNSDILKAKLLLRKFDCVKDGLFLFDYASRTKVGIYEEFKDILNKVKELDMLIKGDPLYKTRPLALCHNDMYEPNILISLDESLYIIDWEYAGLNDPIVDVTAVLARSYYSDSETIEFLEDFLEHKMNQEEYRFFLSYIAITAFYWFCWGLYKSAVGDDDGFFFIPSYRSCVRYLDKCIKLYEDGV